MVKQLLKKWPTNLKNSFMIGDKKSDKICAKRSGLYFEFAKKNLFKQIVCLEEYFDYNSFYQKFYIV